MCGAAAACILSYQIAYRKLKLFSQAQQKDKGLEGQLDLTQAPNVPKRPHWVVWVLFVLDLNKNSIPFPGHCRVKRNDDKERKVPLAFQELFVFGHATSIEA